MNPIVLESLVQSLRDADFVVGIDHYARVRVLAQRLPDLAPSELKFVLGPLFATKPEEQRRFGEVFDAWLDSFPGEQAGGGIEAHVATANVPAALFPPRVIATAASVLALLLLAGAVAALMWTRRDVDWPARPPRTVTPRLYTPPPPPLLLETPTVSITTRSIQVRRTVVEPFPRPTRVDVPNPRRGNLFRSIGALLLLVAMYDVVRSAARWVSRQKFGPQGGPYKFVLRSDAAASVFETAALRTAIAHLRARQGEERTVFDVGATVLATVRNAGLPQFVERPATGVPAYLLLIDRRGESDHQAEYFERLATILSRSVLSETWFFDRDPRALWNATGRMELTALFERWPGATLVLCGDGAGLLDPVTGAPAPWLGEQLRWSSRAILTPCAPHTVLRRTFDVFPGTTEGLSQLGEALHGVPSNPLFDSRLPDRLNVDDLRRAFPPALFRWVCACAVQDELQWDATLAIGRALGVVSDSALLRLASVAWFRAGVIPERQRFQLLDLLHELPEDERHAREAAISALESLKPDLRSFAAASRDAQLALHRLSLAPSAPARAEIAALRNLPTGVVLRIGELRRRLYAPAALGLWKQFPAFRRAIFRGGSRLLGRRNFAATLIVLALVMIAGAVVGAMVPETMPATKFVPAQRTRVLTETVTETYELPRTDTAPTEQESQRPPEESRRPQEEPQGTPSGTPSREAAPTTVADTAPTVEMRTETAPIPDSPKPVQAPERRESICKGSGNSTLTAISFDKCNDEFREGPAVLRFSEGRAIDVVITRVNLPRAPGGRTLSITRPLPPDAPAGDTMLMLEIPSDISDLLLDAKRADLEVSAGNVTSVYGVTYTPMPPLNGPADNSTVSLGDNQGLLWTWMLAEPAQLFIDCDGANEMRMALTRNGSVYVPQRASKKCQWYVIGKNATGKAWPTDKKNFIINRRRTLTISLKWGQNFTDESEKVHRRVLIVNGVNQSSQKIQNVRINGKEAHIAVEAMSSPMGHFEVHSDRFWGWIDESEVTSELTTQVRFTEGWGIVDVQRVPRN